MHAEYFFRLMPRKVQKHCIFDLIVPQVQPLSGGTAKQILVS